jgi:acetyltransferase
VVDVVASINRPFDKLIDRVFRLICDVPEWRTMKTSALDCRMKNGVPYKIEPCVEADTEHTPEFLKIQIASGFDRLSTQSRWQRFASPLSRLSASQLDYLTSLDGKDRVAWCASTQEGKDVTGIGLARYVKSPDESGVAEFAITVVDAYQGQGVGYELLKRLIASAGSNHIAMLKGYILRSNKRMLALCKRFDAVFHDEDPTFLVAEIRVR